MIFFLVIILGRRLSNGNRHCPKNRKIPSTITSRAYFHDTKVIDIPNPPSSLTPIAGHICSNLNEKYLINVHANTAIGDKQVCIQTITPFSWTRFQTIVGTNRMFVQPRFVTYILQLSPLFFRHCLIY